MRRLPSSDTASFLLAPCSNVRHCNATAIQLLSVEHAGSIRTGARRAIRVAAFPEAPRTDELRLTVELTSEEPE